MAPLTAVDWLLENIPQRFANALKNECEDIILGAKQIEKEQIIKAHGLKYYDLNEETVNGEQYYNEQYGK